jgi:outer membrane receptor protein involved in Fe transport
MVINGGFRWDMFSPGSAGQIKIQSEDLNSNVFKYKHQFSPRLGFAFPITERDGFNFHYGRFVQFPSRAVLFASQETVGNNGTLGNPNLDAMTTIQYQSGIKHQFNDFLALQFAVYNRDIFGLVASTQVTDEATGNTLNRYINRAYGNARGIELTLERRMNNRWAFELAYTYAFADGVASSQQFGSNPNGLEFLPNQELPLDWDQRHSVAMQLRLAEPGSWAASLVFDYGSGFPWTPFYRFDRRQDPLLENSRRLPADYDLRIQAERNVNVYGQKLTLYLQGLNLLNQDQVASIQPGLNPGSILATNAGLSYLTETGKFGGAYLVDVDGDNRNDFVPLNDPRVFSQHRLFRIGLGWRF